jgi:A/G-specific adenine glycosylase
MTSASHRKIAAQKYISSLDVGHDDLCQAKHIAELDSLLHVFTHLKLSMHVHLFTVAADTETATALAFPPTRKWVPTDAMDNETLSTGMRRCWDLAKVR